MGHYPSKGVCQESWLFLTCMRPPAALTETLRAGQLEGTQEQFARGGRAVSMHDGRHPCAGLKINTVPGGFRCRHCSLQGYA